MFDVATSAAEGTLPPRSSTVRSSVFIVRSDEARAFPILVVDGPDGAKIVPSAPIRFINNLAISGFSLSKQKGVMLVLRLLNDFVVWKFGHGPLGLEELPEIVAAFLRARRNGHQELRWEPVKRQTVERDRHFLRIYSEFCADSLGYFPLMPGNLVPMEKDGRTHRLLMRNLQRKKTMVLGHLASKHKHKPNASVALRERTVARRYSKKPYMNRAMIEDLIAETKSPSQRLAFTQCAFGGQRISEVLNQWRCDVLPGRFRPILFPDDVASEVPLVVLAHPSQSLYTGGERPGKNDRLQHLYEKYSGMIPRNIMEGDPMEAGWKGVLLDNDDLLISQSPIQKFSCRPNILRYAA